MGWQEKINHNSTWFKKHHPELLEKILKVNPIIPGELKPRKNRLVNFIRSIIKSIWIWITKSTAGQLSPKEN